MRRKVPWSVAIPPEVMTEYCKVKLGDCYTNSEIMLEVQLKAKEIFHQLYGFPKGGIGPTYSAYVEASQLGVEVLFPKDNMPMVKSPVMKGAKDVYKLKILNPYKEGLMAKSIETYHFMRKKVGDKIPVGLGGTEGPVTTAVIVRDQEFFIDILLHPKEAKKLLEIVTDLSLLLREVIEKITGEKIEATGIADDFSGLLSPEQYEEFVVPYHRKIYGAYGKKGRSLHSELLRKEHLKFLTLLDITHYDPGCDQFLTVKDILKEIPGIPFSFNLKSPSDMLQGSPETIKGKYRKAVADGASEMMTELCRGVPKENILAFIEVAKEMGKG
jgi:uroporphyrinogen decarboxylase